jgi:hypothetical protein
MKSCSKHKRGGTVNGIPSGMPYTVRRQPLWWGMVLARRLAVGVVHS